MAVLDALFKLDNYVGPESLTELCFKLICDNLNIISVEKPKGRVLLKGLSFPSQICDKLIEYVIQKNNIKNHDTFFTIFEDLSATKLKHVKIVRSNLTDFSIAIIARHKPVDIELTDCPNLTARTIELINEHSENLRSLSIMSHNANLIVRTDIGSLSSDNRMFRGYVFELPNLRRLTLMPLKLAEFIYDILFGKLGELTHLDLSRGHCHFCGSYAFFQLIPNLVSLTLYDFKFNPQLSEFVEPLFKGIYQLKQLRHLDISQSSNENGSFLNASQILSSLVASLPKLTSLDISGTNLGGRVPLYNHFDMEDGLRESTVLCGIPGLLTRMDKPLEFLGLYGTAHAACWRENIPAKVIAGDANEEQLLIAAHVCMDSKKELLQNVLKDLYHALRYDNFQRMDQALCVVLEAVEKYPYQRSIQMPGIAALYYIIKLKEKEKLKVRVKRRIINALLTGMTAHRDVESVMRNGCLALCRFRIPQDVMSNYETLVKVLLYSARHAVQESLVQRIGIHILNSLACQVEGREKRLLGKLGCVKTMLELVRRRVEVYAFDEVLEVAWSTIWNMTDETPANCARFFEENGMYLFLRCVRQYPQKAELLKNMMGLLGNVAEVDYLRRHFMQEHYVTVFADLVRTNTNWIEVSYNAAGILAHMTSDGPKAWIIEKPSRKEVLEYMVEAIEQWDVSSERNINYRSFVPLLRLLDVHHTPECQHWAVWAFANLTNVYPNKYCPLLMKEGGLEKLNELILDPRPYARIKELAQFVIDNCAQYTQKTNEGNVPHSSSDGAYSLEG